MRAFRIAVLPLYKIRPPVLRFDDRPLCYAAFSAARQADIKVFPNSSFLAHNSMHSAILFLQFLRLSVSCGIVSKRMRVGLSSNLFHHLVGASPYFLSPIAVTKFQVNPLSKCTGGEKSLRSRRLSRKRYEIGPCCRGYTIDSIRAGSDDLV